MGAVDGPGWDRTIIENGIGGTVENHPQQKGLVCTGKCGVGRTYSGTSHVEGR